MMNSRKHAPESIKDKLEFESIADVSIEELLASFMEDTSLHQPSRGTRVRWDPRSDEAIIYNPLRAARPHDYPDRSSENQPCPICEGDTTGILDWIDLNEGFSFINKNLFPVLTVPSSLLEDGKPSSYPGWGLHLVQWTSSFHDRDWHNLPLEDCVKVMERLAVVEDVLIQTGQFLTRREDKSTDDLGNRWYVSTIKNYGSAVGGSLEHGHQQILLSNVAPKRMLDNQAFFQNTGVYFSEFIQTNNPQDLFIRDYGPAVLLVSEFMRRPYQMVLAVRDIDKSFLHELDRDEIRAISRGWKDVCAVFQMIMPELNREVAYNVVTHNGPGAGLYFEFLPYTQEEGGLENLGLSACQADPFQVAAEIRERLD